MRMQGLPVPISELQRASRSMTSPEGRFHVVARVALFDATVFEQSPWYNASGTQKIKLQADIFEDTTRVAVTMWHDAVTNYTGSSADQLSDLWADCESDEGKAAFLDALNAGTRDEIRCYVAAKPWLKTVQYNLNGVEGLAA